MERSHRVQPDDPRNRRHRTTAAWTVLALCCAATSSSSEAQEGRPSAREPVYRVSKAKLDSQSKHPLDPALDMARQGLEKIQSGVRDYTCILVKRERVKGELGDHQFIFTKVRNRQVRDGRTAVPFSVYMYFLKPSEVKGREVIYVEGQNNNKLCAHEGGRRGNLLPSVWLAPDSMLAMQGQLYPITDVGIENLIVKLIERGERERKFPEVEVGFKSQARVKDRTCTVLEIRHPQHRPDYEFYHAQVFIDDELRIPIRYAAYGWPENKDEEPPLIEEYTYMDLKINAGLTDSDFDTKNEKYNF
ncbi:MAG: DUF1571 domain-containing protein [Planctomycetes bacterium]|nr:DUF1571 domain-containing protein [Planctomycetota bacterium]